jgi:hypothetical protein
VHSAAAAAGGRLDDDHHNVVMQALLSLAGVLVGGLLVIAADAVRRRSEWKQKQLQRLLDNGVELLAVHHRLVGDLVEAHELGLAVERVHGGSGERYRAGTQLAATPGSESLLDDAEQLRRLHRQLRDSYGQPERWERARAEYVSVLHAFEGRLRMIASRGKIA